MIHSPQNKASTCLTERRKIKREERNEAIVIELADKKGGGRGANATIAKRFYLFLYRNTLQRINKENRKQTFSEKELHGHSPNFHIHVSVSDYIIPRSIFLFCCRKYVDRSWEYINCSQAHECGNWD
jgi:hypothetical protein